MNQVLPDIVVAFNVRNAKGNVLCGTSSHDQEIAFPELPVGAEFVVTFRQKFQMNPADYLLSVGPSSLAEGKLIAQDLRLDYLLFTTVAREMRFGFYDPESVIEWERLT